MVVFIGKKKLYSTFLVICAKLSGPTGGASACNGFHSRGITGSPLCSQKQVTAVLSFSQMQLAIGLLVTEGTKLGSSLVPEAAFGAGVLHESSPFRAAIESSLSSLVAHLSSAGAHINHFLWHRSYKNKKNKT